MAPIKLFMGAPDYATCTDEADLTITQFLPTFHLLLHERPTSSRRLTSTPASGKSHAEPVWRCVTDRAQRLPASTFQDAWLQPTPMDAQHSARIPRTINLQELEDGQEPMPSFVPAATTSSSATESFDSDELEEAEASLLDESLTLHEDGLTTTSILALTQPRSPEGTAAFALGAATIQKYRRIDQLELTRLRSIPSAAQLDALYPQTVTVNLLVSVIHAGTPRTVTIKRTGKEVDLAELLVGDETQSGFQITVWLGDAARGERGSNGLRDALASVRGGDVALVQNVALKSYKRSVLGQSLGRPKNPRGDAGFATTLEVVSRNYERLPAQVPERLRIVKAWSRDFVGAPVAAATTMPPPSAQPLRTRSTVDEALPENETPERSLRPRKRYRA